MSRQLVASHLGSRINGNCFFGRRYYYLFCCSGVIMNARKLPPKLLTPNERKNIRVFCKSQQKNLALDDEAYRALLRGATGVSSSTEIKTQVQRQAVIDAFRRVAGSPPAQGVLSEAQRSLVAAACKCLGLSEADLRSILRFRLQIQSLDEFKSQRQFDLLVAIFERMGFVRSNPFAQPTQANVARWYWSELFEVGAVDSGSDAALASFVLRQAGAELRAKLDKREVLILPSTDPLAWVPPQLWFSVIEALKKMLERKNG